MQRTENNAARWTVELWLHPMLRNARPARARVFREVLSILQRAAEPTLRAGDSWTPLLDGSTVAIGPFSTLWKCLAAVKAFGRIKGLVVRPRRR